MSKGTVKFLHAKGFGFITEEAKQQRTFCSL
jgi:cold shock CspA family protein